MLVKGHVSLLILSGFIPQECPLCLSWTCEQVSYIHKNTESLLKRSSSLEIAGIQNNICNKLFFWPQVKFRHSHCSLSFNEQVPHSRINLMKMFGCWQTVEKSVRAGQHQYFSCGTFSCSSISKKEGVAFPREIIPAQSFHFKMKHF